MRQNPPSLRRWHRHRLLFVATTLLPVFLVLYSEYISSKAAQRDQHNEGHSVVQLALSSFHDHGDESGKPVETTELSIAQREFSLPPLDTILAPNGTIIGDAQILLHYAIIGFGKTGTTSMLQLLQSHQGLQSLDSEVWALIEHNPARLIKRLHKTLVRNLPRGYKCPGDVLADYVLDYYRTLWPKTRLIVGVRHPVKWFESLYNFRVQHLKNFDVLREPNDLVGPCTKAMKMICTKRGNFAWYLLFMGKQLLSHSGNSTVVRRRYTPLEKEVATFYETLPIYKRRIKPMFNPVFLYDLHQLGDANTTRRERFRRDVANFLGVDPDGFTTDLSADLNHVSPGREWDAATQALKDAKKIDICDPRHVPVRLELMKQARLSSKWIRTVFLRSPGVYSSSPDYLDNLLLSWMDDPCGGNETAEVVEQRAIRPHASNDDTRYGSSEYALPPYSSLFNANNELKSSGDPQVLLSFSVIGFGKTGTTSLVNWLSEHPELQTLKGELWALPMQQPSRLLTQLYRELPRNLRRGYKCPGDVLSEYSRTFYRRFLPKTKLFIGVRHPVLWFESLYNFRLQSLEDSEALPEPGQLIGLCRKNMKLVCTYRGNFGHHLLQFGKHLNATTRPFSPLEKQLATWYRKYSFGPSDITPMPNDVFIYEVNQLADRDAVRRKQLRDDIQAYLGLSQEFPGDATHYTPGRVWDHEVQAEKDKRKINICDDSYLLLRAELMLQATTSSLWIRQVFLDSPGVYVSSRPYFEELLEQWMHDPCNNKTNGIEAPSVMRQRIAQNQVAPDQNEDGPVHGGRRQLSVFVGGIGNFSGDIGTQ